MLENTDYITIEEKNMFLSIKEKTNKPLYKIGQICGVTDRGYWSRIINGKKPVPPHVRLAITKFLAKENKNDK